jgi:hypothetical protein
MSKPVSVQEAHFAEVERLRRIRQAEPMLVSIELDESQIAFLADLAGVEGEERNSPRVIGASLKSWLKLFLKGDALEWLPEERRKEDTSE